VEAKEKEKEKEEEVVMGEKVDERLSFCRCYRFNFFCNNYL
jgi:hypothetical protein